MEFITRDLIDRASQTPVPYGALGAVVDTRTYLRYLPEEQRRETPWERNARVTNYNVSLASGLQSEDELQAEAELMFDRFNHLKAWASGRVAWVGGTKITDTVPEACFNCSALAVDRLASFTEAFHLLMLGCGVGFRVLRSDVSQLPTFRQDFKIEVLPVEIKPEYERQESTSVELNGPVVRVTIGDSRQGWVDALGLLLKLASEDKEFQSVEFDFNNVRPYGDRIKGFGGTASGYAPLRKMLLEVTDIICNAPAPQLRPIDAMDIMCCIGSCVVAGNVRRSAEICLFDPSDTETASAKRGLWTDEKLADKRYRAMSNNSGVYYDRPEKDFLRELFQVIRYEGEPGFINGAGHKSRRREAALKWRPDEPVSNYVDNAGLTNPCAEILLSSGYAGAKAGSFCNLTALPLPEFVKEAADGGFEVDYEELDISLRLITRIGLRQTCVNISLPLWDKTQKQERLLGVDCCGWVELFDKLGWAVDSDEANALRKWCHDTANDEATKYAEHLGVLRPLLVTTNKPNGTYAQLNTIASGLHWPYAPYYLRRIRMSRTDALALTLRDQGVPIYPESFVLDGLEEAQGANIWEKLEWYRNLPGEARDRVLQQSDTWVLEFPVKTAARRKSSDVSAIEQLENYKCTTKHYCDHNASVTITVADDEWDAVVDWVYDNWEDFVGISFLPKCADDVYPLLPYQAMTEEEYEERAKSAVFSVDFERLAFYERLMDDPDAVDLESDCVGGACPVR
ncbi:MAG: ribonucleoside-triphosphate reductase, adenosylcobalamin-dependent [Synechococcus sp.]